MLLIPCPYCGPRAEIEFHWGGPSHVIAPAEGDDAWGDYLFYRDNTLGLHSERWVHRHGCGSWFNLRRDTLTHRIERSYSMTTIAPDAAGRNRL